jgi:hypothetical protein
MLVTQTLRKAAYKIDVLANQPKWSHAKGSAEKSYLFMERSVYQTVANLLREWADSTLRRN